MARRVVQVGVGGFGAGWSELLAKAGEVELAGVVDTSREALDSCRTRLGLDEKVCHTSLDQALSEIKPDVVVCVTPPEAHREVCVAALETGSHVITEKPLAGCMDDARRMVEAAQRAGRRLAVSQNYRYGPAALTVRELIRSGKHGTPASFSLQFFRGPRFEGFRRRMPYPLVADMSIHHYDLMRAILGLDPVWTFARTFNPPWSWYDGDASHHQVIAFEGEILGSYSASWCSLGREMSWNGNWRFECSEGVILWEEDRVFAGPEPGQLDEVPLLEPAAAGQAAVLAEFVSALDEDRAPETDAQDNLKSLAMVFKTIDASESGGVVNF